MRLLRGMVALAVVTIAAHAWNLSGEFVFDDVVYIVMNPEVQRGLANWTRFFTDHTTYSSVSTDHYRPLVTWLNAANVSMGGSVTVFKLTQVMLHLLTVLGLYSLLSLCSRRLKSLPPGVPWGTAALFAVLPFNVEAVHYLTARSAVLCGLFVVLSLWLFVRLRLAQGVAARGGWYLLHLLALAAALVSKETALVVPALVVLLDLLWVPHKPVRSARQALNVAWPYLPFAAGLVLVWWWMPNVHVIGRHLAYFVDEPGRLAAALFCLVENVRLMILPTGLTITHDILVSGPLWTVTTVVSLLLIAALLGLAWWCRRRAPEVTFGLLWYFLLIAPSTFVHLNTVLMENRGYSASMGICLVLVSLAARLWQRLDRKVVMATALVVICGSLLAVSAQRQLVWGSGIRLWQDTVARQPHGVSARINLAVHYFRNERMDEGEALLLSILDDVPDNSLALNNLGWLYVAQQRDAEAVPILERLVELDRGDPNGWRKLLQAYERLGKPRKALEAARQLMRWESRNNGTRDFRYDTPLGWSLEKRVRLALRLGDIADAEKAIQIYARYYTDDAIRWWLQMMVEAAQGKWSAAEASLEQLERRFPASPRLIGLRQRFEMGRDAAVKPGPVTP